MSKRVKNSSEQASSVAHTEAEAEMGGALAELSFEASLSRLAAIVDKLEDGDLPLDASLALFEEGVGLARASQARLDSAEKRVEQLLAIDEEGRPIVKTLDLE